MSNKYVDFVSDEDFLECVKHVCDVYPKGVGKTNIEELKRNALDNTKLMFDVCNNGLNFPQWLTGERIRQTDKTVSNRIGDFHQKLLGKVEGWEDLKRGHPYGIDLKNKENSIFIELKNKHNTVKGEDHKNVFDKLKKVLSEHKQAIIYYAYIIPKRPSSGERIWKPSQREPHQQIKEAWGARVYEIVTEDKESLKKTIQAIPTAIKDLTKNQHKLSKEDKAIIEEIFRVE